MRIIRVGSRESRLAVRQAQIVMECIQRHSPELRLEPVTMKTIGDVLLEGPLQEIGGKGLFVRELDQALLDGRIDIAVHSCKDLPAELDGRLPILAMGEREDGRDVLLLPKGRAELEEGPPIGCSSKRRRVLLERLYPGVPVKDIRGNLTTRIAKLDAGEYGALVLAAAGIRRVGLWDRVSRAFTVREMLPAAGQGILAVQGRRGEPAEYLELFCHPPSWNAARAERAFVRALGAGCSSPVAAYAEQRGDALLLGGMAALEEASPRFGELAGPAGDPEGLGEALARQIMREDT